jgi:hypothetical protein
MVATGRKEFRLSVLNPSGHDSEQYFDERSRPVTAHPPINFHAFAACTSGSFHRETRKAVAEKTPVLLLIRGDFKATARALAELKETRQKVAVSLKETGLHQIANQLGDLGRFTRFLQIVTQADGCIATTPEAAEIYRQARQRQAGATVAFIPTPYPLEDRHWDFTVSPMEQAGIFVGTREWDVPSRNHLAALLLARQLCDASGEPVTVFNLDGRKGERLLSELKFPEGKLRLIEKSKSYPEYLRIVARHKIVLQLDRSRVPGQVAGDALLCRTICVGGDGAIERLAFANFCGERRTVEQLSAAALELLNDTHKRAAAIAESQSRALERVSFRAVRTRLETFFGQL